MITGRLAVGFWCAFATFISLFFASNLRSSLIVQRFEPEINTLEDAKNLLPNVYVPMFPFFNKGEHYLPLYWDVLGPELFEKV